MGEDLRTIQGSNLNNFVNYSEHDARNQNYWDMRKLGVQLYVYYIDDNDQ